MVLEDNTLSVFNVVIKETDLWVRADKDLMETTRDLVLECRLPLERYVERNPQFLHSLSPVEMDPLAPPIVKTMIEASMKVGVGPMAAVAGTIAEYVGRELLAYSREVIVENGGDIFIRTDSPLTVGIFAGASPLSQKVGLRVDPNGAPIAVCTSSGTVGHSLSLGRADAVTIVSRSGALADAAATAVGNRVLRRSDIKTAIDWAKEVEGVLGILIIYREKIGLWGDFELVRTT
nr:UPF0280 family protein [Desulfobacterales bacterium]